ncbi:MAG: alpha/beta hydrolase [Proteobacteria bacterium]|nr:alpha/beta hydrolase [Pseudomonadota bacterium]
MKKQELFVTTGNIRLWTESFGNSSRPHILLIMGLATPGIFWSDAFCERLANEGYFVIRYDNRDVGLSSAINYEQEPYTIEDCAKDALAILDAYHLSKAIIVGESMGGMITQWLAAYYPSRVMCAVMIGSSPDFGVSFSKEDNPSLSLTSEKYTDWLLQLQGKKPRQIKNDIENGVEGWRICNGDELPFDTALFTVLVAEAFQRNPRISTLNNHLAAIRASYKDTTQALGKISCPTLVIHGGIDPIFPPDHGQALAKTIPNATLKLHPKMGHFFSPSFYGEIIHNIDSFIKAQGNS